MHDTPGRFQPPQSTDDHSVLGTGALPYCIVSYHGSMSLRSRYADTRDSRNRSMWTNGHLFVHAICSSLSTHRRAVRSFVRSAMPCTRLPARATTHPFQAQASHSARRTSTIRAWIRAAPIYAQDLACLGPHSLCTLKPTHARHRARFACTRSPTKDIIKPPTTTAQKGVSKTRGPPPPPPVPPEARPLALPAAT